MTYFKNKTVIMSGGSRGVGLEIAKALGKDGANIAILAKTTEPHPKLPGTIFTAAKIKLEPENDFASSFTKDNTSEKSSFL